MFKKWNHSLEFFLLLLLLFAVPAFEAPKNLLWLAYVVTWLVNRYRSRDFGGPWDAWDTLIAAWLFSGYLVAAFANLHGSEWMGAHDMTTYLSLLWLVKRSGYRTHQLMLIPLLAVVGVLPTLVHSLWRVFVTHQKDVIELNSVGHVNHSAIYLAIVLGTALAVVLDWWGRISALLRSLGVVVLVLLGSALLMTASRGAVVALLLLILIQAAAWLRRSPKLGAAIVAITLLLAGTAYLIKVDVVAKHEANVAAHNTLSNRDAVWNAAIDTWHHAPLFGIGINNYKQVNLEKLKDWQEADGKPFNAADYFITSHAHSLYFGSLAERGVMGFSVLLVVLGYWLYSLFRHFPGRDDADTEWALWGGALSAWTISVVAGLVNSTLHHEHAILSALLLGAWLAYRKTHRE